MLAREYCDSSKRKLKPIIISHPMLPGLKEGQEKMSKSDPDSAIFMEDSAEDVRLKIKKAFCPPLIVEGNPCLGYVKHIILPWRHSFTVAYSEDKGGDKYDPCALALRPPVCPDATMSSLFVARPVASTRLVRGSAIRIESQVNPLRLCASEHTSLALAEECLFSEV